MRRYARPLLPISTVKNPKNLVVALFSLLALAVTAAQANQPFKWPNASDKDQPVPASDTAKGAGDDKKAASTNKDDDDPAAKDFSRRDNNSKKQEKAQAALDPKRPFSPEAIKHYNKGVELHQTGFLNQAIEEYKQALAADPRVEPAWSNLGGIYAAQRSYNKAMDAFEKAYELNPNRPTTLNGMATVLYARGKVEEAKDKWKQAIQVDPHFYSAYYNIGNACEGEKRPQEAVEWYVKAVDLNPKMGDAFFRVGCIYTKDKHPAQAELMLEKAIEAEPEAEFTKEARRLLSNIRNEYQHDMESQGELKMNVVPPVASNSADGQRTAGAPNTVSKAEQSASVEPDSTHKHKKKKKDKGAPSEQPVEPTPTADSSADELQPKPAQ